MNNKYLPVAAATSTTVIMAAQTLTMLASIMAVASTTAVAVTMVAAVAAITVAASATLPTTAVGAGSGGLSSL